MAWTAPRTWVTNELVTAALLNEQVRDNLTALKFPATSVLNYAPATDVTCTSTQFVNMPGGHADGTLRLDLSLPGGGKALIGFYGTLNISASQYAYYLGLSVNGTILGGDGVMHANTATTHPVSFTFLATLGPGEHIFRMAWKVTGGTATLWRTGHSCQFWAREV